MENRKFAIVRMFAPEKWGQGERFAKLYSGTFNFSDWKKKAVSGAVNHFTKAMVLKTLSAKLKPNLEIDLQQLEKNGYTKAENSKELSAVIETIFTELYSSIDCTTTIVFAIFNNKCRGLPNSTRNMFKNIRNGKVCNDFPEALRSAFQEAVWFDELLSIRDELTHSDIGQCHLDKNTGLVLYIHTGIKKSGSGLLIDDIFQKIGFLFEEVNKFLGRVFFHLNSLLKNEPMPQTCGIFNGRVYTRHVIPSMATDFNSGTCDSYRWFDLPDNPKCPFADSCGAYASAKS